MFYKNTSYETGFSLQDRETSYHGRMKETIKRDTIAGLRKLKPFAFVQLCLSVLTIIFGGATIAVTMDNAGFPVFNVGPLITGVTVFISGVFGLYATWQGSKRRCYNDMDNTDCMVKSNFGITIVSVAMATVSLIVAFMSVTVCFDMETEFFRTNDVGGRELINVEQYCHPNRDAKIALAFIDGCLCLLLFVWNMYGFCIYCSYGPLFGIGRCGTI